MGSNAEQGHQGMALHPSRELLEVERGGFAQIGEGLLDGVSLGCRARLGIKGPIPVLLSGGEHRSEFHRLW